MTEICIPKVKDMHIVPFYIMAVFILSPLQFEKGHKIIVFVSSCEAVEFLLILFNAVLSGPKAKQQPPLSFFRLHGNMKQEVRPYFFNLPCTHVTVAC